jgi:arginyl-tRNA synthetase
MIEERLTELIRSAVEKAGLLPDAASVEIEITRPRQKEHGDFSTNVALALSRGVGRPAREVAEAIRDHLPSTGLVESCEVAGPGFLNFRVTNAWLLEALRSVAELGEGYGRAEPTGRRAQVEFVSANPNGPLTIGHARNAAIGDAIARLLAFTGWSVEREYYFNDAGGQMDRFGASVEARYLQLLGEKAEVPDDGYQGEYVLEYARDILEREGPGLAELAPEERVVHLRDEAVTLAMRSIRSTLERFGVTMDVYFSESELVARGEIAEAVDRLRASGHAYEADGAVWFRSTAFGDDKDRVVVRSNGRHTYFGADCAYVVDKFARGFDHVIYVWGADHHGDVVRVRGAAEALGFDPAEVEIVLYQFVSFLRGGEPVAMSTRAGEFVTLDELIDEVGTDAARFHLLMFSHDSTITFDIEAVKRLSMDNPVYYVQYGHARIASILRKAGERGVDLRPVASADLALLSHEAEIELLRAIADVPAEIARAAELRAPHRLTHAAQGLAAQFHRFYTECPVLSDDAELTQARLWLCVGAKRVIGNLLDLLGVSAPESMVRDDAADG